MESEAKIQHNCVMWFDAEYPEYRGLTYTTITIILQTKYKAVY